MAAECNEVYGGSQPAGINNEFLEAPFGSCKQAAHLTRPLRQQGFKDRRPAATGRGAVAGRGILKMATLLTNGRSARATGSEKVKTKRLRRNRLKALAAFKADDLFYNETFFRDLLLLERKRTERSRNPFLLMLLSVSGTATGRNRRRIMGKIIGHMTRFTRETDIRGWYVDQNVLGVIYLDCDTICKDKVVAKVSDAMDSVLSTTQKEQVSVSWYPFPAINGYNGTIPPDINAILYKSSFGDSAAGRASLFCKRMLDIVGSIAGIIVCLPLFLIVAPLIRITSPGPVFFRQERIGRFGRKFSLIKFRTMRQETSSDIHRKYVTDFIRNSPACAGCAAEPIYKMKDDPRITSIGRFLRRTSLDEVPQFLNVLLGQMSLVGPRPALEYEVDLYDIWHRRRVFEVKPGMTGIWQIKGRSRTDFNTMVRMDIRYIKNWSPVMDIELVLKTPLALVSAKGAC